MRVVTKIGVPLLAFACALAVAQTDAASRERLTRHAEVFKRYSGHGRAARLEDLKPNSQGVVEHSWVEVADYMQDPRPLTPSQDLARTAKRFDAVVYGTAAARYSAIDPTHAFLYSDWIVNVVKVYKYPSAMTIGQEITVTRIGGDLTLNGQRIIDRTPLFPELALSHQYVFFLRALPDTSSFLAFSGATFDVTGGAPVLIADPRNPTTMKAFSAWSTADFLSEVERSAAQ